nr:MAG TPA: minor capsid protein [Caudoviricetes sp.]
MLSEYQLELLPERICERLSKINTDCIISIAEVLKKIGELRPTDVHQLQQMYNYGADIDQIIQALSAASEKNIAEIEEVFEIVAKANYDYSTPFYEAAKGEAAVPYEKNTRLKRYVNSVARQTVKEYKNLTQHTAFAVFEKDGKSIAPLFAENKNKVATSISETYTKIIDLAVQKVQTGTSSYQQEMRNVIRALSQSGIKSVDYASGDKRRLTKSVKYASGYKRRLDSSVRQNILWGIKECNQNSADIVGEQLGADGYEISYHSNPRDTHADMGGRQYAKGKKGVTVKGKYYPPFSEVEGLLKEYGCRHIKFSIFLGISVPTYSEKELREKKQRDKQTFEYEGKKYTGYEATQVQKKLESSMRRERELMQAFRAFGDKDSENEARTRLRHLTSQYASFSKAAGLSTKMERTRLAVSGKNSLTAAVNGGIMKEKKVVTGHNGTPKTSTPHAVVDHSSNNKIDVRSFYDRKGLKCKDINTTSHGNPKHHPFGKNGEHAHDYEWDKNGNLKNRTTRELTEKERKDNEDIL